MLTPEYSRTLRGLIIHGKPMAEKNANRGYVSRALIAPFPAESGTRGVCRWCRLPAPSRRHLWHEECLAAYRLALGRQATGLSAHATCAMCGEYDKCDVDHRLALSVAWSTRRVRVLLRAYMLGNLQRLCKACHGAKSGLDRRRRNNLLLGRAEYHRIFREPPPQLELEFVT